MRALTATGGSPGRARGSILTPKSMRHRRVTRRIVHGRGMYRRVPEPGPSRVVASTCVSWRARPQGPTEAYLKYLKYVDRGGGKKAKGRRQSTGAGLPLRLDADEEAMSEVAL